MINQTTTKQVGLICNMKTLVHRISCVMTFPMMQNNGVNYDYFLLLLGRQDAKFSHDWSNKLVTIQGNNIIKTIAITKHLSSDTK
jgi:hypothetical protein